METRKAKTMVAATVALSACGILVYALTATGGGLEPIAPPGPTMYSLEEIYNLIGSQVQKPKAFDCFLEIESGEQEYEGECTEPGHEGWIELLAYSHGVSQEAEAGGGPGGGPTVGKCEHKVLTVVKLLDKTSPKLSLDCCNGAVIDEVVIELCEASGTKQMFMKYRLEGVIISAVNPFTAGATLAARPLEEVSFVYDKITWEYTPLYSGKPGGVVDHWWSLVQNTGG